MNADLLDPFDLGFTLGWHHGFDAGQASVFQKMAFADAEFAATIRRRGPAPEAFLVLQARRAEPGRLALEWRERHGEYVGGRPVPWEVAA